MENVLVFSNKNFSWGFFDGWPSSYLDEGATCEGQKHEENCISIT